MPHMKQGPKVWLPWLGAFCDDGVLGRMTTMVSGAMAAAHSTGSAIVAIPAYEDSASAFGIVAEKMGTGGTASTMSHAVNSSMGAGRAG
jgi:hypothetical protein